MHTRRLAGRGPKIREGNRVHRVSHFYAFRSLREEKDERNRRLIVDAE